jgi:hypothetical protein
MPLDSCGRQRCLNPARCQNQTLAVSCAKRLAVQDRHSRRRNHQRLETDSAKHIGRGEWSPPWPDSVINSTLGKQGADVQADSGQNVGHGAPGKAMQKYDSIIALAD